MRLTMPPLSRRILLPLAVLAAVLGVIGSQPLPLLPQQAVQTGYRGTHGGTPASRPSPTEGAHPHATQQPSPAPSPTRRPGQPGKAGKPITPPARPTARAIPASPSILAEDSFTGRTTSSVWGRASDGHLWGGDANAAAGFSVENGEGQIEGTGAFDAVLGPVTANADVTVEGSLERFEGGGTNMGVVLRWKDTKNWHKAYLDGSMLVIARSVAGQITALASIPFPALGGLCYRIRFRAVGTRLWAKAWPMLAPEPAWWLGVSDNSFGEGRSGIRVLLQPDCDARISSFVARRA